MSAEIAGFPLRRAGRGKRPSAPDAVTETDVDQAYERICEAIMDHSLPPETRLVETKLCEIFSLGRTRVRQVLQRLANERLVTLMPNRGAVVCKPTTQDALDVFEARRLLEAGIVAKFVQVATDADIQRVSAMLEAEQDAWKRRDRRAMIRLSGEFHLLLAEIAGNHTLLELLRELVSRSSLIVAVYQAPGASSCPPDEHSSLYQALLARSANASGLMLEHLDHVLGELQLEEPETPGVDLYSVLAPPART
ncbi:MAG: GntR family transcriptional regulator [Gammaproteobacteria bacterium]|nr:GntR family transcriptional regulator [Gammaproteobacteria bacterium]